MSFIVVLVTEPNDSFEKTKTKNETKLLVLKDKGNILDNFGVFEFVKKTC